MFTNPLTPSWKTGTLLLCATREKNIRIGHHIIATATGIITTDKKKTVPAKTVIF